MTDAAIFDFVANQKRLLELELKYEEDEVLRLGAQKVGKNEEEPPQTVLRNLELVEISVGLLGRTVATLSIASPAVNSLVANHAVNGSRKVALSPTSSLLPAHRLTVGDEVEIISKNHQHSNGNRGGCPGGVISALTDRSISIALFSQYHQSKREAIVQTKQENENGNDAAGNYDTWDALGAPPLIVVPRSSLEVHRKIIASLDELQRHGTNHPLAGRVIQALFDPARQELNESPGNSSGKHSEIQPFNQNLDPSQIAAIEFALTGEHPIALIRKLVGVFC